MNKRLDEKSPPGWGGTVEKMKKDKVENPFALAWSMYKKGYEPHYNTSGSKKLKFREYFKQRKEGLNEDLDHNQATELVFHSLGLQTPKGGASKDEVDTILGMPIKGYGRKAFKNLSEDQTIRNLKNYQGEILPALTKDDTTVGDIIGFVTNGNAVEDEPNASHQDEENDDDEIV